MYDEMVDLLELQMKNWKLWTKTQELTIFSQVSLVLKLQKIP
jgi:hypothetical protein